MEEKDNTHYNVHSKSISISVYLPGLSSLLWCWSLLGDWTSPNRTPYKDKKNTSISVL